MLSAIGADFAGLACAVAAWAISRPGMFELRQAHAACNIGELAGIDSLFGSGQMLANECARIDMALFASISLLPAAILLGMWSGGTTLIDIWKFDGAKAVNK